MGQPVQFQLRDTVFSYGEDMGLCARYREKGEILASKASIEFIKQYRKYDSLDEFCKKGYEWGAKVLTDAVGQAVQCCIDAGHYDINEEAFIAHDTEKIIVTPWTKVFSEVFQAYFDIESERLSEEQRRELRKEARGRFVGGGFGLSNAIVASIQAGAVNMVTGAAHSVFNAIGNAMTSYSVEKKKSAIYGNPDILKHLQEGLAESVRNVFEILIFNVLQLKPFGKFEKDLRRAESMQDNINHGRIPHDKVYETLCEILQINPFKEDTYTAMRSKMRSFQDIRNFYLMKKFFGITRKQHGKEVIEAYLKNDSAEEIQKRSEVLAENLAAKVSLADEFYKNGNLKDAEELLLEAIAQGSSAAMKLYIRGCEERLFNDGIVHDLYLELSEANDYDTVLKMGHKYETGKYPFEKNINKALECYQRVETSAASQKLKAEASLQLAYMYQNSEMEDDKESLTLKYAQKALNYGEPAAAVILEKHAINEKKYIDAFSFMCAYLGLDVNQTFKIDEKENVVLEGHALNEALALYELGIIFELGSVKLKEELGITGSPDTEKNIISENKESAMAYYAEAVKCGCAEAAFRRGQLYEQGSGCSKDMSLAVQEYLKAIELGMAAEAADRLGAIYGDGNNELYDLEKAIQYYTQAFEAGVENEAIILASIYGNEQNACYDIAKAMKYYSAAANNGNGEAAAYMGWLCEGNKGVQKDLEKAVHYYGLAVQAKNGSAAYRLGQLYEGANGMPVNQTEVLKWYRLAESLGVKDVYLPLGEKYWKGIGVGKDLKLAEIYYKKGISAGYEAGFICLGDLYKDENRLIDAENSYSQLAVKGNEEAVQRLNELQSGRALQQEKVRVKEAEDARMREYERQAAIERAKQRTNAVFKAIYRTFLGIFMIGYGITAFSYYNVVGYNGSIVDFLWDTVRLYLGTILGIILHLVSQL